jgi:N-dimethylarginine dimethylaminohydrolase
MAAKSIVNNDMPTKEKSKEEFSAFEDAMIKEGIEVLHEVPCPPESAVVNQSYSRDIGFVIADTFYISSMARPSRINEWHSIASLIERMPEERVVKVPQNLVAEGGDIVVDKGHVFVGISQRTTKEGFDYLSGQVTDSGLKFVPIYLRSLTEGADVLHLDCAFVPVGEDSALIFEQGMDEIPEEIRRNYNLIAVTEEEQQELATNVLAISPSRVMARDSAHRANDEMSKHGIEVIPIKFDQAPRVGGSLRCCTLPLVRASTNQS